MKIAVPDLVTNSYFPALAAEELGLYAAEGVDAHVVLLSPALGAMAALKSGDVELVVTGAHTTLTAFPDWKGAKLAVAVAQGTPWLLVLRSDIAARRGDVHAVKGLKIGAAPGPTRRCCVCSPRPGSISTAIRFASSGFRGPSARAFPSASSRRRHSSRARSTDSGPTRWAVRRPCAAA